ncbi:uncharacterized protein LOC130749572 [Lotus japonicus]|uniref:uncharacterized protein LOC130749572 n=1 Tax=Lotus japonicus TaxID=34305 RepID=UPI00258CCF27|nr:uncharacterized protein LOC130749572 [Lotus japonicus]
MNMDGEKNNEKKAAASKLISKSWLEKLEVCRREEEKLRNDIQELDKWVDMIGTMDDKQLKEYLENHPRDSTMTTKSQKMKSKVQRKESTSKSKSSISNGILASVLKFDKKE